MRQSGHVLMVLLHSVMCERQKRCAQLSGLVGCSSAPMQMAHVVSPPALPAASLAELTALSVRSGAPGGGELRRGELIRKIPHVSTIGFFHLEENS